MRNKKRIKKGGGLIGVVLLALISLMGCEQEVLKSDDDEQDENLPEITDYPIASTNQTIFYNNSTEISAPSVVEPFYGQDASYASNAPSYVDNGDGTVTDMVTGLMWQQSADLDGDGIINVDDKLSYAAAISGAKMLNLAGYSDWRLPDIKELYSLILFSGEDPSAYEGTSTDGLIPFIDTDFFEFAYGDTDAEERIIDAQYATTSIYVDYTMNGDETMFGVNFADGRIKGYPLELQGSDKLFYVMYVRGNIDYGVNELVDNNDGTISDLATGLMWMQMDSQEGMSWEAALAYAENKEFAGYSDWRLPDIKELHSIVDYTKAPVATDSPAINSIFYCSGIIAEDGEDDYPFYWSSTTHANQSIMSGGQGAYMSFGRAMGKMNGTWLDVHGAGAQRSDPKTGDAGEYPDGHGPQGDAIRILNYVRCVRTIE